jgi:hypothetical protein
MSDGISSFTDFCDAIQLAIGPGGNVSGNVQIYPGKQYEQPHASPPIISVFPIAAGYGGPMGAGAATNPRILHTRQMRCEVHCWGVNHGNAEGLQNGFITAMRQVMNGANYVLMGDVWHEAGILKAGTAVVTTVDLKFGVPVAKLPLNPMVSAGEMVVDTAATVAVTAVQASAYAVSDHE